MEYTDVHGLLFVSDMAQAMRDIETIESCIESGDTELGNRLGQWAREELAGMELADRLAILESVTARIEQSPRRNALAGCFGLPRKYKPMKKGIVQEQAKWFVEKILERDFDWTVDRRYLREARLLLNPPEGKGNPLDRSVVCGTLLALKLGILEYDNALTSMWCITYGNPPYYQQYQEWSANPPPHYMHSEVSLWEEITGREAYEQIAPDITVCLPTVPEFDLET